jgi:hypothetical protein
MGNCFTAAVTNKKILRIFSPMGKHIYILMLPGIPVALVGRATILVPVYHSSVPYPDGSQNLSYEILDVATCNLLHKGKLAISMGASLVWIGISAEGILHAADSEGILFTIDQSYNGVWIPIWSSNKKCEEYLMSYFIIGATKSHVVCITCNTKDNIPTVIPSPEHIYFPFDILICRDENQIIDCMNDSICESEMDYKTEADKNKIFSERFDNYETNDRMKKKLKFSQDTSDQRNFQKCGTVTNCSEKDETNKEFKLQHFNGFLAQKYLSLESNRNVSYMESNTDQPFGEKELISNFYFNDLNSTNNLKMNIIQNPSFNLLNPKTWFGKLENKINERNATNPFLRKHIR